MRLILVGCGKMGSALLNSWLKANIADEYIIIDPTPSLNSHFNITHLTALSDLDDNYQADCIIFAIKPQIASEIIPEYKKFISPNTLFISIMAGISISNIENYLANDAKIIRAMPNTPAAIGQGISVLTGNHQISEIDKNMAINLLSSVGDTVWSDSENVMNAVTAVSGSGPAYVFLLIEVMTNAGISAGLSPEMAEKLARKTVIGSAYLAEEQKDISASKLRENVTSPNGTTAAALDVLMNSENNLQELMNKAIMAAKKRGEELAN